LWWRARLLNDVSKDDSFHLVGELGEDELFQITERPSIRGYPPLAVAIGNVLIEAHEASGRSVARSELVREIVKWLIRYRSIVLFESMTESDLKQTVNTAAQLALSGMTTGEVGTPEIIPPSRSDAIDRISDAEVESAVTSTSSDSLTKETLAEYLEFLGLDIRDRLDLGGNLWVLGDSALDAVMAQLDAKGLKFDFKPEGGRGTGYQPAWLFGGVVRATTDGRGGSIESIPPIEPNMETAPTDDRITQISEFLGQWDDEERRLAGLVTLLHSLNLEVRDQIATTGNLWIVGGSELMRLTGVLTIVGNEFELRPAGDRETDWRMAWLHSRHK